MTPLNSLASSPGLEVTTFRRWFRTPLESCFAFYLREVWNHIGSEVTKKDDRVSSAVDPVSSSPGELGPSSYAGGWERERGWFPLSFILRRDARYPRRMPFPSLPSLSRIKSLFRARGRFRRMAHVPSHGNYEIRDTGHVLSVFSPSLRRPPVCRITFVLPSGPGCPRARRLAKVRMMYRVATIMAFLAALSETSRLSSIIFNADKYHSPKLLRDDAEYARRTFRTRLWDRSLTTWRNLLLENWKE